MERCTVNIRIKVYSSIVKPKYTESKILPRIGMIIQRSDYYDWSSTD